MFQLDIRYDRNIGRDTNAEQAFGEQKSDLCTSPLALYPWERVPFFVRGFLIRISS